MLPDVNFTAAYQTNDFDANSSTVFSEGNLGEIEIQYQWDLPSLIIWDECQSVQT